MTISAFLSSFRRVAVNHTSLANGIVGSKGLVTPQSY